MTSSPRARAAIWTAVSTMSIACMPPRAVATYAAAATRVTSEFPAIAGDMHASCLRFQSFSLQRRGDGWYDEAMLRSGCASTDTAVAAVIGVNRVLSGYFAALARLADDRIVSTDTEVKLLSASLISKAGMNQAQESAVSALLQYVSSTLLDIRRRPKLAQAITSQNANVIVVTNGLRDIVSKDYLQLLIDEETAANSFYRTVVREGRPREPLAAVLLMDVRDERARQLGNRREALDAYAKALGTISAGHQKLYLRRNTLGAKELAAELAGHAETLDKLAKRIEKAF
ncbi:MAG: hypothetical protein H0U59_11900 [Gemmatimonadaceae bacterium]|nr:hypothetical protein [Gemmatimonadaceae bacterium]MDQ3244504.1 hypothetical protein [Gemmatimonadota bacterium]